jgi:hypothetical protein
MKPNWIIRMGEKLHGNFTALTLAGLMTAAPTCIVFKNWADENHAKDTNALITRAKEQSEKYGHVLVYSGTEISRTEDTWTRGNDSKVIILADEPTRVTFEQAKKQIADDTRYAGRSVAIGLVCGVLMGAAAGIMFSLGTGYCRNRAYAMRQSAQNRAAMKKHGLDHFNPN